MLIDLLKRSEPATTALERWVGEDEELATTSLNVAEVLRGVGGKRQALALAIDLLGGLVEVPLGPRAARRYGRLMHALDHGGKPLPAMDGLVAAIVLENGGRLVTRNTRHFGRVPGLEVLVPRARR